MDEQSKRYKKTSASMFMVSVHTKEKSPMEIHRALLRQNIAEKRKNQSDTDKKRGIYLVKTISSVDRSVLSAWPECHAGAACLG